jgi:hypothetical protein
MEWRLVTPPKRKDYAPQRYTLRKAASVQNAETKNWTPKGSLFYISAVILIANVIRWSISACAKAITVRSPKGKTLHDW